MVGLILANGYQNAKFEIYQNLPPPKLPAIQYLNTLDQSIPDNVSSHTVLLSPVDDISSTPVSNIEGNKLFNVYTLFLCILDQ